MKKKRAMIGIIGLPAAGDPVCRQANPPREQPSRLFKIWTAVQSEDM